MAALSLALAVRAYAVKPYRIPSVSMEPTLKVGDRLLIDRASHRLGAQPGVGDIVVFRPPAGADAAPPACGSPAFLLGDNRGESLDSCFWGPVPVSWVVGKAVAGYWPPRRFGAV